MSLAMRTRRVRVGASLSSLRSFSRQAPLGGLDRRAPHANLGRKDAKAGEADAGTRGSHLPRVKPQPKARRLHFELLCPALHRRAVVAKDQHVGRVASNRMDS